MAQSTAAKRTGKGGARPGAGRPPKPDKLNKFYVAFTREQSAYIEAISAQEGLSFSEGLRLLVSVIMGENNKA